MNDANGDEAIRDSRESSLTSLTSFNSEDERDDDIIISAIKTIVKATSTPHGATMAIQLLERELKRSFGGGDDCNDDCDDDENESQLEYPDMDDGDDDFDMRNQVEGRLITEKHKKTETEKWKELMVRFK